MRLIAFICLPMVFALACNKAPNKPKTRDGDGPSSQNGRQGPSDDSDDTAGPVIAGFNTALPRLTHEEWENVVRDTFLLNGRPGMASRFSQDDNSTIFHNDSAANKVTSNLWKDYQEASEELGEKIATDGGVRGKLIPGNAPAGESEARAKAILAPLLRRAYRRPATEAELNGLTAIFMKGKQLTGKGNFDEGGLKAVTAAILQSPQFIYHPEIGAEGGEKAKLSSFEIATRLSFAIWKSIPDDELLTAAESNALQDPEKAKAQVERMMKDPRAANTLRYFLSELFETKKFVNLQKNQKLYPKFPNDLGDTLKREADLFIEEVALKEEGGITRLLTAPYTFVNDKTAPLYDLPPPGTMDLTKVNLDPKKRVGLIMQLGWLASNATSERTSTIHRGFYVMNRLACDQLPPMVGADSPNQKEFKTRRDEITDKTGGCGGNCHNNFINPPAFALEAFDAAGVYRTTENGNPIDTSGVYGEASARDAPTKFKDAVEMMNGITSRITTHECFVKRAIELLYNRRVNESDEAIVRRLGEASLKGMGANDILVELLSDYAILSQRNDKKN